jgi:hypothetical protein
MSAWAKLKALPPLVSASARALQDRANMRKDPASRRMPGKGYDLRIGFALVRPARARTSATAAAAGDRLRPLRRTMPSVRLIAGRPQIDRVMDFARLPEAKARMEAGAHIGKIVLRMPA